MKFFTIFIIVLVFPYLYSNAQGEQELIRVEAISFLIYNEETGEFDKEITNPDNYEFLCGDTLYGVIIPVVTFMNVSADTLQFNASVSMLNEAADTMIYLENYTINKSFLQAGNVNIIALNEENGKNIPRGNLNGLPPVSRIKIRFAPLHTNDFMKDPKGNRVYAGDINVTATIDNLKSSTGNILSGYLKNKKNLNIYSVLRAYIIFPGPIDFYKNDNGKLLPDPWLWHNCGAEVVDLEGLLDWRRNIYTIEGNHFIRLKRNIGNNNDTIISIILNSESSGHYDDLGSVFSFSLMQGLKKEIPRGYRDSVLSGPEPIIYNSADNSVLDEKYDKLVVEISYAIKDSVHKLLNSDSQLNDSIIDFNEDFIPYFTIMEISGGSIKKAEYLQDVSDSNKYKLKMIKSHDIRDNGRNGQIRRIKSVLNLNQHGLIKLPDYFRIRIRNVSHNDGVPGKIEDDEDDFFINDLEICRSDFVTDISTNNVSFRNPYSIFPLQKDFPFNFVTEISNNYVRYGMSIFEITKILSINDSSTFHYCGLSYYDRNFDDICDGCGGINMGLAIKSIFIDTPLLDSVINYDSLRIGLFKNLFKKGLNKFQVIAYDFVPGGEIFNYTDTIYAEFHLNLGDVIAYDYPSDEGRNDAETMSGIPGKGISLPAYASGEFLPEYAYGFPESGNGGRIAMKFRLFNKDTVYGYQAYYGSHNPGHDKVVFALYSYDSTDKPADIIEGSRLTTSRMWDDTKQEFIADRYVTHLLDKPLILNRGTYWLVIKQPDSRPLELGASGYRAGLMTTSVDTVNKSTGNAVYLEDSFRKLTNSGEIINRNLFMYNNSPDAGEWKKFVPDSGNPVYAHLDYLGTVKGVHTYSRGSWIPMLRVFFDSSYTRPTEVESAETLQQPVINIYPNPAADYAIIKYHQTEPSFTEITLCDAFGNEAAKYSTGFEETGNHTFSIDCSRLANGLYFIRINTGNGSLTGRLSILR